MFHFCTADCYNGDVKYFSFIKAVYADTRIMPFVWMVSSLPEMQQKYLSQKEHPDYKVG